MSVNKILIVLFFSGALVFFNLYSSPLFENDGITHKDSMYIADAGTYLYDTLTFNLFDKIPYDVYSTGYSIKKQYVDSLVQQNDWFYFNNATNRKSDYIRILYNRIPELYHYVDYDIGCIIINKGNTFEDTFIIYTADTIYTYITSSTTSVDTFCIDNLTCLDLSTSSIRISFTIPSRKNDSLQCKFIIGKYKR